MASDKPADVRVYSTDTIVDNPGAEIAYKGFICVGGEWRMRVPMVDVMETQNKKDRLRAELIEKGKKKAEELHANAIVGMRLETTIDSTRMGWEIVCTGTAVHVLNRAASDLRINGSVNRVNWLI